MGHLECLTLGFLNAHQYKNMANYLLLEESNECVDICTYARKMCLPSYQNCANTCIDWIVRDCSKTWNCNRCQKDKEYLHPVVSGEQIMFQTKFYDKYNEDREQPTNGWGTFVDVEVLDSCGAVLESGYDDISTQYLAGWDGDNSYQLINIDIDSIPQECFSLSFVAYDQEGNETERYCTEDFKKVLCEDTVKVCSEYCSTDCCNNYYGEVLSDTSWVGTSPLVYSNCTRYYARFTEQPGQVTRESFNSITTQSDVTCNYDFALTKLVPPNISGMLIKQHMSGEKVFINDEEYFFDSINGENRSNGRMHMYTISLTQSCSNDFRCC